MGQPINLIQLTPEQLQKIEELHKGIEELTKNFQKPPTQEEYLTKNEAAELLKVNPSTIFNWTSKGILKSYGLGGRIYYKRSEIEECITPIK